MVGDERQEKTAAHDAVREALINCIVHQDLNATGNIVVRRTETELTFSNPGMMLVSKQQYFKGGRSICRNPTLQKMFIIPEWGFPARTCFGKPHSLFGV
ncbi:hypothetical protein [Phocaeicola plebeius]